MSDAVQIALITSGFTFITLLFNTIVMLRTHKAVAQVHIATNSMKDALVASTRRDALAEGRREGVIQERGEQAQARSEDRKERQLVLDEKRDAATRNVLDGPR